MDTVLHYFWNDPNWLVKSLVVGMAMCIFFLSPFVVLLWHKNKKYEERRATQSLHSSYVLVKYIIEHDEICEQDVRIWLGPIATRTPYRKTESTLRQCLVGSHQDSIMLLMTAKKWVETRKEFDRCRENITEADLAALIAIART